MLCMVRMWDRKEVSRNTVVTSSIRWLVQAEASAAATTAALTTSSASSKHSLALATHSPSTKPACQTTRPTFGKAESYSSPLAAAGVEEELPVGSASASGWAMACRAHRREG